MSGHKIAGAALLCYPSWWRELYVEEVGQLTEDLLADGRSELRLAANLFKGALSQRLWARAMPPRAELWHARARASIAVATLPFLGVLPFVFFGLDENSGYTTLPRAQLLELVRSQRGQATAQMDSLLHVGVIVGLVAALVGWTALFDGAKASRVLVPSRPRLLLRLPFVFLAFLLGLYMARRTQLPNGAHQLAHVMVATGGHPAAAAALLDTIWALLVVGAAVTILAIARVAKVCELPWRIMVSGRRVAMVTASVLAAMAFCAVVGLFVSGPHGFVVGSTGVGAGDPSTPYTTFMVFPHWALMASVLVIAAVTSLAGWQSSRRAANMLRSLDPRIGIAYNGV